MQRGTNISHLGVPIPEDNSWEVFRIWFDKVADYATDPLWIKDASGRFVVANLALKKTFSQDGSLDVIGKSDLELHPPELGKKYYFEEQKVIQDDVPMLRKEVFVYLPSGEIQWHETTKIPLKDDSGNIIGLFGISHDITSRKQSEFLRNGESKVLQMIAKGVSIDLILRELLSVMGASINCVETAFLQPDTDNDTLRSETLGKFPASFRRAFKEVRLSQVAKMHKKSGKNAGTEITASTSLGDALQILLTNLTEAHGYVSSSTKIETQDGGFHGILFFYSTDSSTPFSLVTPLVQEATRIATIAFERDVAQSRIKYLAEYDSLTGAWNRSKITSEIDALLHSSEATKRQFAIVFADLDRFKRINDSLGHYTGDKVLKTIANRLKHLLGPDDYVARIGGDEFVITINRNTSDWKAYLPDLEAIQATISEKIDLGSISFQIFSSLGVSIYPKDGDQTESLLRCADAAMFQAKTLGRNCYQFYSPRLAMDQARKFQLLQDMRAGIRDHQFFLEYQPQFDLHSGQPSGVEALIRWNHPQFGIIPPGEFINEAEESGLISELGDWVLGEACRQGSAWCLIENTPVRVSVNVSANQLLLGNFTSKVRNVVEQADFDPTLLELELTESSLVEDPTKCAVILEELRNLGAKIALDDFGTGYSSLSLLNSLPLDRLKIDRSFVLKMQKGREQHSIIRAIVALGQELNLRVIAEGVESQSQFEDIRALNCDGIQGYYTGRPMSAELITDLLRSNVSIEDAVKLAQTDSGQ